MNRLSFTTCIILSFLCACTQSITPTSTPSVSTNTSPTPMTSYSLKQQLTQQLTRLYLDWQPTPPPTNPDLASYQVSKDKYLFEQFAGLLSNPDTQTLSLEDLQEILRFAGGDSGVFYEGSDPNYILASYGDTYYPGGHNYTLPGIYVFSRTGELWEIGSGVIGIGDQTSSTYLHALEEGRVSLSTTDRMRTLDNGWVFAVDLTRNSAIAATNYAVWQVRQTGDQWQLEELIRVNWGKKAPCSVPFLKFDEGQHHLTVSYMGDSDILPCQFNEQIMEEYYITPYYEYITIFERQEGMYIQTDQWEEAVFIQMSKLNDDGSLYSQTFYDWQEYCED